MQKSGKTGNNLNITRSEWFGSKRGMGGSVLNKIRKIFYLKTFLRKKFFT